jgi:hypothetical protein
MRCYLRAGWRCRRRLVKPPSRLGGSRSFHTWTWSTSWLKIVVVCRQEVWDKQELAIIWRIGGPIVDTGLLEVMRGWAGKVCPIAEGCGRELHGHNAGPLIVQLGPERMQQKHSHISQCANVGSPAKMNIGGSADDHQSHPRAGAREGADPVKAQSESHDRSIRHLYTGCSSCSYITRICWYLLHDNAYISAW